MGCSRGLPLFAALNRQQVNLLLSTLEAVLATFHKYPVALSHVLDDEEKVSVSLIILFRSTRPGEQGNPATLGRKPTLYAIMQ